MKVELLYRGPAARALAIETAANWVKDDEYYRTQGGLSQKDGGDVPRDQPWSYGARVRSQSKAFNKAYLSEEAGPLLAAGETLGWVTSNDNSTELWFVPAGVMVRYVGRRARCRADFPELAKLQAEVVSYETTEPALLWDQSLWDYLLSKGATISEASRLIKKAPRAPDLETLTRMPVFNKVLPALDKSEAWVNASYSGEERRAAMLLRALAKKA